MAADDWTDIKPRIDALAVNPAAAKVFGAQPGHGWRLEPPLSPADVSDLEQSLGVTLPNAYRSFLLEVSAGGAGPYYGLFPVIRTENGWDWEGDGHYLESTATRTKPFPHVAPFNPAAGLPDPPDEDDFATEDDYWAAADAYYEHHDKIAWAEHHYNGLLCLCELGCAIRESLVLNGPARGQMWHDDTANDNGFHPLTDDEGRPLDFAAWYRRWLDEAERAAS